MPLWVPPYKIRRSNRILSFAVNQNYNLLEVAGEACFLLKRKVRRNAPFQVDSRKVSTITETARANTYTIDAETGFLKYCLWSESTDPNTKYPDIGAFTCTVTASASGTNVWEPAVDKYSFINGRAEYAFDIYQDQIDSNGTALDDAVYVVFNTPPFTVGCVAAFTFGNINPLVSFTAMQPVRDTEETFQNSLFGFDQWLNPFPKIRKRYAPNAFLLAFPGVKSDFSITEGGLLRETKGEWWTNPEPVIVEHDVIIRELTTERFQVIDYTPIYIENILVSQHFNLAALDPRSSIYSIEYDKGHI
jgi:hypothetical protein